MNTELVDSLTQAILYVSEDERFLLSEKLDTESKSTPGLKQRDLEVTFVKLVKQWREENHGVSSTNQMSMHPAYQKIIGMGEAAIPLLLKELEKNQDNGFGH
jgi:hypothetical protein